MIDGLYHTERKYKGKDIVIDISQEHSAFGDCFEVMALYSRSGEELSSEICHELSDAIDVYNAMLEEFLDRVCSVSSTKMNAVTSRQKGSEQFSDLVRFMSRRATAITQQEVS